MFDMTTLAHCLAATSRFHQEHPGYVALFMVDGPEPGLRSVVAFGEDAIALTHHAALGTYETRIDEERVTMTSVLLRDAEPLVGSIVAAGGRVIMCERTA